MRRLMILSVLSVPALLISATALGGDVVAKLEVWDPKTGSHAATALYDGAVCPVAVKFRGRLAASAAGTVRYQFVRSDGAAGPVQAWDLPAAGHKDVETTWTLGKDYSGWVALKVLSPQETQSEKAEFKVVCGAAARPLEPAAQPPLRPIPREGERPREHPVGQAIPKEGQRPREHPVGQAIPKEGTQARPAGHEALPIGELVPLEENTDRPGLDYKDFDLTESRPELCRNACLQEPRCRAFTYGRPGLFGNPKAHCWLKTGVPDAVAHAQCISGVVPGGLPRPAGPDRDQDGLADDREQALLQRFRPDLMYSRDNGDEEYRPSDPLWHIRHSTLLSDGDEDSEAVVSHEALEASPAAILTANKAGADWGSSDLSRNPRKTRYYLNIHNESRSGLSWSEILSRRNIGLFGHVVPYRTEGRKYIKIEYYHFFGYSDTKKALDVGDHEADWEISLIVLYDPARDAIVSTFHYAHGVEMRYDMGSTRETREWQSQIQAARAGEAVVPQAFKEFRGPNYDTSSFDIGGPDEFSGSFEARPAKAQNNLVRLLKDPVTGEYSHAVVYIENGCHGCWPSEHWSYWAAPKHGGDSHSFLSSTPPNLGEVDFPLSEEARIILHYNGRWGAYGRKTGKPPGPQLHWEWTWPADSALRRAIDDEHFEDGGSSWRR